MHSISAGSAAVEPGSSGTGSKLDSIPNLKLNDGYEIPMLAYGLGTARTTEESEETVRLTAMAIRNGYYHLDGAQSYKNEAALGAAIAQSGVDRARLFVTTKLQNVNMDASRAIDESLARLGLSYVDLYLIHAPFAAASSPEVLRGAWRALEAIRASGRARSIGVSNFSVAHLETILAGADVVPAVNQVEFHPYLQQQHADDDDEGGGLLAFCRARGIAVAAYGALAPVTKASPGPCDAAYARLARKYAVREADVALRWCLDQGVAVVTTSASEERLRGYAERVPAFALAPAEVAEIAAEGRKKHFRGFWTKWYPDEGKQ
ncbi:putative aldehyde reductase 1 protein [Rosellinia necatrix]|uniref:Putative aldehyde reductase 1 protein n=1 Tax=Rosellinia necatrix TaxID=77044 RepID=A0A1W2TCE9_ROSNE|nr:putative aldehyde reductase 1 protein [Rosellinia necatrix]